MDKEDKKRRLSVVAQELKDFLKIQGWAPTEPLSVGRLAAYGYGRRVPDACERLARLLLDEKMAWDFLPKKFYRPQTVQSELQRGSRIGFSFSAKERDGWNDVFVGFLFDRALHKIELCGPDKNGPAL